MNSRYEDFVSSLERSDWSSTTTSDGTDEEFWCLDQSFSAPVDYIGHVTTLTAYDLPARNTWDESLGFNRFEPQQDIEPETQTTACHPEIPAALCGPSWVKTAQMGYLSRRNEHDHFSRLSNLPDSEMVAFTGAGLSIPPYTAPDSYVPLPRSNAFQTNLTSMDMSVDCYDASLPSPDNTTFATSPTDIRCFMRQDIDEQTVGSTDGPPVFSLPVFRSDPPPTDHTESGRLRRQKPRFAGDEYTASWVRGEGIDRAGWCGLCASWHKLKDSAYWYHMHYSHGISCHTGKPFDQPSSWRQAPGSIAREALCSGCKQWINLGRADRWHTPFFRHAYKCQLKSRPSSEKSGSRGKDISPATSTAPGSIWLQQYAPRSQHPSL